jgi:glutathione peroxidase
MIMSYNFLYIISFLLIACGATFIFCFSQRAPENDTAYRFYFTGMDDKSVPLADFKGKVLLIVNTASACGFTPQYKELEELYNRYKDKGLVVIGVPSNSFGNQESGSNKEITCFVADHYAVTFPLMAKTDVAGATAHPFYLWAEEKAGWFGKPRWNFHKYLIGRDGEFIDWFVSTTSPLSSKVVKAIEAALKQ